jgi:hypothetical protein
MTGVKPPRREDKSADTSSKTLNRSLPTNGPRTASQPEKGAGGSCVRGFNAKDTHPMTLLLSCRLACPSR